MAIKLVAFDWNGTLLSDTAVCLRAEGLAMASVGLKPISLLKFRQTFDVPITKFWKDAGFPEHIFKKHFVKIEDAFHSNYERLANRARSRAGAKEVLSWLGKNHILSVIYSNHNHPNIYRQLVRLKIEKDIRHIVARKEHDHSQLFQRYKAEKLHVYVMDKNIKPREVISVGDTEEEIQIGKQYGYHTVAITGGYNTTSRLKKHHPDFLMHNMKELIGIIKRLNSASKSASDG